MIKTPVAFFFNAEFPGGGTGKICLDIVEQLAAYGHPITLYCYKAPTTRSSLDYEVIEIPHKPNQKMRKTEAEALLFSTEDKVEGMRAFVEKRKAVFQRK